MSTSGDLLMSVKLLAVLTVALVYAPVAMAGPKQTLNGSVSTRQVGKRAPDQYDLAKRQLPEQFYTLYRITERLARANKLDTLPWRVSFSPEYETNAFSTDSNLLAVYSGLYDKLNGDTSALACVVGHEMGHTVKRHVAVRTGQSKQLEAKLRQEVIEEAKAESERRQSQASTNSLLGLLGLKAFQQPVSQLSESEISAMVQRKKESLNQEMTEIDRKQEFEADAEGVKFMVQAGFEPQGCLRAMEILGRTPTAELDTDHPAIPRRIAAIEEMLAAMPIPQMIAEGKSNTALSKPLTYDISADGASLRINSTHGSASQDFERLFGK
jgi:beta-barrel assembly-enhancing protease